MDSKDFRIGDRVESIAGSFYGESGVVVDIYPDNTLDVLFDGHTHSKFKNVENILLTSAFVAIPEPDPHHAQLGGGTRTAQVGGDHYQKSIQPWDIIRVWKLGYWRGNVVKYILRQKNGKEDLEKARHYLDHLIENYDELKKDGLF